MTVAPPRPLRAIRRLVPRPPTGHERPSTAGPVLDRARDRAQHVIVLMLENRSFDHMFGRLAHPGLTPLSDVGYRNPIRGRRRLPAVETHRATSPALPKDPPHTHAGAMTQMAGGPAGFAMDGFATAYADHIVDGKGHHVRWRNVRRAAAVAGALLGEAVVGGFDVADGPVRFAVTLSVAFLVITSAVLNLKRRGVPGLTWKVAIAAAVLAPVVVALAAQGVASGAGWQVHVWVVVPAAAAVAAAEWLRIRSVPHRLTDEELLAAVRPIMGQLDPDEHLPALAHLARTYALCTRWFSSTPGSTWPNRCFVHSGSADQVADNDIGFFRGATIFGQLELVGETWRIYHHDLPQVACYPDLWLGRPDKAERWGDLPRLLADIAGGTLPRYSFVEPAHGGDSSNSQHPSDNEGDSAEDFARGDDMIRSIHDALVANPRLFEKTVLIVTYDEHGGLFDHVPPPRAVPPAAPARRLDITRRVTRLFLHRDTDDFAFDHLGVRVPAVVVSPWVEWRSVDDTVYDHTSVPRSLQLLCDTAGLGPRADAANDLLHLIGSYEGDRPPGPDPEPVPGGPIAGSTPAPAGDRDLPPDRAEVAPAKHKDDFKDQLAALATQVDDAIGPAPTRRAAAPEPASSASARFRRYAG